MQQQNNHSCSEVMNCVQVMSKEFSPKAMASQIPPLNHMTHMFIWFSRISSPLRGSEYELTVVLQTIDTSYEVTNVQVSWDDTTLSIPIITH